jgi:hypothetical protein
MAGTETVFLGSPSSFNQTIFAATTLTASASGAKIPGIEKYTSALFYLTVGTVSGSTPLLDVYIQTLLPNATTWQDIAHFTQVTSSTVSEIIHFVTGASSVAAVQTETLASATIKAIGLGCFIRVRCKVAGTTPSFATVTVTANFFE